MSQATVEKRVEKWDESRAVRWMVAHLQKEERQDANDVCHDAYVIWRGHLDVHAGEPLYMPIVSALHYARRRYRQERYRHTRKYRGAKLWHINYRDRNLAYHDRRIQLKEKAEYYTNRERRVLTLMAEGYPLGKPETVRCGDRDVIVPSIADLLGVSPSRITQLVSRIRGKAVVYGLMHVPPKLESCPSPVPLVPRPTRAGIGNWETSVLGGVATPPNGTTCHVPRQLPPDERAELQRAMSVARYGRQELPSGTIATRLVWIDNQAYAYIGP